MIYTFATRKELNRLLCKALPGYNYTEEKIGVPHMRMDRLPDDAVMVEHAHTLELYAYNYWEAHRNPIPVFITIGCGADRFVDVNYVSHRSEKSLALAGEYIPKRSYMWCNL